MGPANPFAPVRVVRQTPPGPSEILVLSTPRDGPALVAHLARLAPRAAVSLIATREQLDAARPRLGPHVRLVGFGSGVIVPADVLEAVRHSAYNFHPGPPTYPGMYPEVFALYDGATRFGATFHVMAPRVDEGPIVEALWFDVPPDTDRNRLATMAVEAVIKLVIRHGPALALSPAPLPLSPTERWSGRKSRMADVKDLSRITPDMPADEVRRRARAIVGGIDGRLELHIHDRILHSELDPAVSGLWPWS